jgi:hypothetical protein
LHCCHQPNVRQTERSAGKTERTEKCATIDRSLTKNGRSHWCLRIAH